MAAAVENVLMEALSKCGMLGDDVEAAAAAGRLGLEGGRLLARRAWSRSSRTDAGVCMRVDGCRR